MRRISDLFGAFIFQLSSLSGENDCEVWPAPAKGFFPLDVAAAATSINPVGGFEFVNTAIAVINQIHSPKSQLSRMNFIQDSMSFEKSLGILARADFERVMRLALAITPSPRVKTSSTAARRGYAFRKLYRPREQPA
jgi:hypothetical protein